MLVLSRKLGEKIYIGDNICITVVDIDRGKIRLGIEAPRDVPIYRQELLPRKGTPPSVPETPVAPRERDWQKVSEKTDCGRTTRAATPPGAAALARLQRVR